MSEESFQNSFFNTEYLKANLEGRGNSRERAMVRILLVHGSGLGNVGDSAQMYAATERLERLVPGCQVIVAKMYEQDDGRLWEGRTGVPAIHLYMRRRLGGFTRVWIKVFQKLHMKPLVRCVTFLVFLSRLVRVVCAARFASLFGVVPMINRNGREAITAVRRCDVVYCSGGGNLNDIWLCGELLPRALTYRLASLFNKPLFISGQGIGPLESQLGRYLMRWGAREAKVFGCRDKQESRSLLLSLGFDPKVAQSLGDEAVDLRSSSQQRVSEILSDESVPDDGKPLVAVHIRLHNFSQDFRGPAAPLLAEMLDRLIERMPCRILFIPVTYSRSRAYEGDIGDAFEVFARMQRRCDVSFICKEKYSPPDMKGLISACKLLIGFSYHAWVFAMTSGIPAFGLYCGEYFRMKAEGFFGWYNRHSWAWNIEDLDTSNVIDTIEEVIKNYPLHKQELSRITQQLVTKVELPVRQIGMSLPMKKS